jgi:hypothetical protein
VARIDGFRLRTHTTGFERHASRRTVLGQVNNAFYAVNERKKLNYTEGVLSIL